MQIWNFPKCILGSSSLLSFSVFLKGGIILLLFSFSFLFHKSDILYRTRCFFLCNLSLIFPHSGTLWFIGSNFFSYSLALFKYLCWLGCFLPPSYTIFILSSFISSIFASFSLSAPANSLLLVCGINIKNKNLEKFAKNDLLHTYR